MTTLAIALIAGSAWAKKEVNAADYPLTAHVVSVSQMRMPMTATAYNQETGERSRVRAITRTHSTTVKIGRVLYIADRVCGGVKAGMDIPARLDEKKNNIWTGGGEQLQLLLGNKVCTLRVVGTEEEQWKALDWRVGFDGTTSLITKDLERINAALSALSSLNGAGRGRGHTAGRRVVRPQRHVSAAARRRMAAAQKARWAKVREQRLKKAA